MLTACVKKLNEICVCLFCKHMKLTLPWPPLALQPLGALSDLKLAHSLKLAFPNMIAPAFLNLITTLASLGTTEPSRANEPAVVFSLSLVPIVSFTKIGMPCNPDSDLGALALRSWSALSASYRASGFTSMIPLRIGLSLRISPR